MRIWIVLFGIAMTFCGCNTLDRPETIPSYIYINTFTLSTDSGTEGENTQAIKDAWVYADGELLGIYELPARVPILASGTKTIELRPGIHNNGISGDRQVYPFYEPFISTINLIQDSMITISPTTTYRPNLEFKIDDFESAGQLLIKHSSSDTTWVIENSGGPTGKFGRLILDGSKFFAYMHTDENNNFPKQGAEVYLELDVRTNNIVRVGVIDENGASPTKVYNNFGVNKPGEGESPSWKKLYIQLTNTLSYESQATQHEFFIDVIKDATVSTAQVDIDNIKIVHF